MSIVERFEMQAMVGDPDDHRPNTMWALVVDDGVASARVASLAVILEEIAPGDRIPLHTHEVDEVIVYRSEGAVVTLGDEQRTVPAGAIEFIPAGMAHGAQNPSSAPVLVTAVFPATSIDVHYLERNPAPGTEHEEPRSILVDLRTGMVTPKG